MRGGGRCNRRGYFQPVAHGGDFSKRNARLHHAKRAGIHAQKHHALAALAEAAQIFRVRLPRVVEGIIDVRDGRAEFQSSHPRRQLLRGGDQFPAGMVNGGRQSPATICESGQKASRKAAHIMIFGEPFT